MNDTRSKKYRYRLFHNKVQKYVAWPHGRGFIETGERFTNIHNMMPLLRIENLMWGASDDAPVLEIHAISSVTQKVLARHSLTTYDAMMAAAR